MLNKTESAAAALAAFLAKGGKVTTCAPSEGNAVSLKTLRKLAEVAPDGRPLARSGRLTTGRTVRSSESYAEEDAEVFGAAFAAGVGADAAMEELNYVRGRRGR
jgi:hypothetical protein